MFLCFIIIAVLRQERTYQVPMERSFSMRVVKFQEEISKRRRKGAS